MVLTEEEAHNIRVDKISCSVDVKASFFSHSRLLNMAMMTEMDIMPGLNDKDFP